MIDVSAFSGNFNGLQVPEVLQQLLEFENTVAAGRYYASGFELVIAGENYGLKSYSEDKAFLNALCVFAQADGTGSQYALWRRNNTEDIGEAPVVILGSEGGFHVVAENLTGLLQILSYDTEPMVDWNSIYFYKDETDYEPGEATEQFHKWLADRFSISPVNDADRIVIAAQAVCGEEFKQWMKKYYNG